MLPGACLGLGHRHSVDVRTLDSRLAGLTSSQKFRACPAGPGQRPKCHLEQSGPGLIYSYLAKCHKTLPRCFQCQLGRSCPKLFQEAALPTCCPNPNCHGTKVAPDPCSVKHQANHADIQPRHNAISRGKALLILQVCLTLSSSHLTLETSKTTPLTDGPERLGN